MGANCKDLPQYWFIMKIPDQDEPWKLPLWFKLDPSPRWCIDFLKKTSTLCWNLTSKISPYLPTITLDWIRGIRLVLVLDQWTLAAMNQNEQLGDQLVEPTTKDNTISGSLTETPSSVPHMLSKQSLKRSLPTSPDSDIADSSVTMSALSQQHADVQSSKPPPEGVNPDIWEMLWSIKHDTARATSLAESLDHRLLILEDSHDNVGTEISILKRTVADIVKSNQVLCGRLFRAEKTNVQRLPISEWEAYGTMSSSVPRAPITKRCEAKILRVFSSDF